MLSLVCCYCELNVIAMTITVGLVSTFGILTALPAQVVFAAPLIRSLDFEIQSNRDNTGYIVCDPNCHAANSDRDDVGSNDNEAQPGYRLTVNVPSHPFGISMVGISITTENGHTDQVSIPTAGDPSHTFDIPKNQGKSVRVCVNSEDLSADICHTYQTTGSDMSVSLSAISSHSIKHHLLSSRSCDSATTAQFCTVPSNPITHLDKPEEQREQTF
jgi:hypothetical protein